MLFGDKRFLRLLDRSPLVQREKGDGDLTDDERRTLEACPLAYLVTIPGAVFFLPIEVPERIAEIILEAIHHAG